MRGIVSEGMILSAEDNEGKLSLLTVTPAAKPGGEIK
jgi:tRNA-binding EMAP/Myf-like protein